VVDWNCENNSVAARKNNENVLLEGPFQALISGSSNIEDMEEEYNYGWLCVN